MRREDRKFPRMGKLIKYRRLGLGLTQDDLASAAQYRDKQFVSLIEGGIATVPNKNIRSIAEALELPVETLKTAKVEDFSANIDKDIMEEECE